MHLHFLAKRITDPGSLVKINGRNSSGNGSKVEALRTPSTSRLACSVCVCVVQFVTSFFFRQTHMKSCIHIHIHICIHTAITCCLSDWLYRNTFVKMVFWILLDPRLLQEQHKWEHACYVLLYNVDYIVADQWHTYCSYIATSEYTQCRLFKRQTMLISHQP